MTRLTPHFITVSNIESRDVAQVIAGNERVVRPRLSDAMFFWQQDLKQPLAAYAAKLATVTFQKELGSSADQSARVVALARHIASAIDADAETAARAAELSKCDLITRMVYEFPELQGLMGGYYARASGETEDIARAIAEHYRPTQQGTPIPSTRAGQIVALADKLDTLAGIFAIGQKPTASKDPFALRRAALGVLRICIEGELAVNLAPLVDRALASQPAGRRDTAMRAEILGFVFDRLPAYYEGVPPEMFEAVKALGVSSPLDVHQRLQALRAFWNLPPARNLAAAHKRVRNILRQAGQPQDAAIDGARLEPADRRLLQAIESVEARASTDYREQLGTLATQLKEPVDTFFAEVMVMAEDPDLRRLRLNLLTRLDRLCRQVADISLLPAELGA